MTVRGSNVKSRIDISGPRVTRRSALGYLAGAAVALVSGPGPRVQAGAVQGAPPSRLAEWPPPAKNGFVQLSGVNVYYEEQGTGIPVVLCAGGRGDGADTTRPLARPLAGKYRVIAWDRSNAGRSDVVFKGSTDVDLWADQLVELLTHLKAAPAYLVGASSGVRTAFAVAVRYPDVVRGIFVFLASGNNLWPDLPRRYWGQPAELAEKGGMQAVVADPFWTWLVQQNPANRQRLLETDPQDFIRVMRRWNQAYKRSDVLLAISEADLRRHSATSIPTRILAGCVEDNGHLREPSERMAALIPHAEFLDPPGFCADWNRRRAEAAAWAKAHKQPTLQPHFEMSVLPSLIEEFITKTEAGTRG
jgi:pimeloyl-ACP methyl ester carboxylesterase